MKKAKKPAKLRLNGMKREFLIRESRKLVAHPDLKEELDKATAELVAYALGVYKRQCPPSEIKVLKKWGQTEFIRDLLVSRGKAGEMFDPKEKTRWNLTSTKVRHEKGIAVPDHSPIAILQSGQDADGLELLSVYQKAKQAYLTAMEKTTYSYRMLIKGATYFEDVLAVWPGAVTFSERMGRKPAPVMVVKGEHIDRIKSDIARRAPATP